MRGAGAMIAVLLATFSLSSSQPARAAPGMPIELTRFASDQAFATGSLDGTLVENGRLALASGQLEGSWTSPAVSARFPFTRLVASWNADTPGESALRLEAAVGTADGEHTNWYTLGVWTADNHTLSRTSVAGQKDPVARVDTDTLVAQQSPFTSYMLRIRLERRAPDGPSPSVGVLAAQVSAVEFSPDMETSAPLTSDAVELAVPTYSQEVHARHYPQWGGGGEAWCSPTSTEMVVEFWGRGPSPADLAWIDPSYADPSIEFAARGTYDAAYRGTGNWPFNTAYAARFGLEAYVTQLRSLAEAELFVRAGIPLVASIASQAGELDGFLFPGGTNGHLVVIVGFDGNGQPIVNDPAAWSNATVRRVYDRAQFERIWLRGSRGTVYVIHPPEVPLPATPVGETPNW
jgi:Peptidase_C39 like family